MAFDPNRICPEISTPLQKQRCVQHKCQWYIQVLGNNPQTGETMAEFGCAIAYLPFLQIETSQQVRQGAAAIESFRNETLRRQEANQKSVSLIAEILKAIYQRLTGGVAPDVQREELPREQIEHQGNSAAR